MIDNCAGCGHCPDTNMQATGIPESLAIAEQVALSRQELNSHCESLKVVIRDEVLVAIHSVPEDVKKTIMDNFVVDGVTPITQAGIQLMISALRDDLTNTLTSRFSTMAAVDVAAPPTNVSVANEGYANFHWGGKMNRYVPESFQFPVHDVKTMWDLWYFGNSMERWRPFKLLHGIHADDIKNHAGRNNFCRTKVVMEWMESSARVQNLLLVNESVSDMSHDRSDSIFEKSFADLILFIYQVPIALRPRVHSVSITTMAENLRKKLRQPAVANEHENENNG